MAAKNITAVQEPLQPVTIAYLYQSLISSTKPLYHQVQQLRALKALNPSAYKLQKTQLPYFTTSTFKPAIRKKENYVGSNCMVFDLDNVSNYNLDIEQLKVQLQAYQYAALLFTSPSGDGIKLLVALSTSIDDINIYKYYYKQILLELEQQFALKGVIDKVTHDVSRCTFMSHDATAYYNPNAPLYPIVDVELSMGVMEFNHAYKQLNTALEPTAEMLKTETTVVDTKQAIPQDVLITIRQKLNENYKPRPVKVYALNIALKEMWPSIILALADYDLVVATEKVISFGIQCTLKHKQLFAEINVYHGKDGFKIIATTKRGTDAALAQLCKQVIETIIDNNQETPCLNLSQ